jgi:hypothetical protein
MVTIIPLVFLFFFFFGHWPLLLPEKKKKKKLLLPSACHNHKQPDTVYFLTKQVAGLEISLI